MKNYIILFTIIENQGKEQNFREIYNVQWWIILI